MNKEDSDPGAWAQNEERTRVQHRRKGLTACKPLAEGDEISTVTDYEKTIGRTEDDYVDTSHSSMDDHDTPLLPEHSRTPYRKR